MLDPSFQPPAEVTWRWFFNPFETTSKQELFPPQVKRFDDISESLGPVLLSLCHLDSQYIEEDIAHEENAAAEKEQFILDFICQYWSLKAVPPVEKSIESFGFKIVNWNIDGDHLGGDKDQTSHNQPKQC